MNLEKFEPIAYYKWSTIYYGLYAPCWGYHNDSEFVLHCYSLECKLPHFIAKDAMVLKIPNKEFKSLEAEYIRKKKNWFKWEPSPEEYKQITKTLVIDVTATAAPGYRKKYKEVLNAVLKFRKDKNRRALSLKEIYDKVYKKLLEERTKLMGSATTGAGTLYVFSDATSCSASDGFIYNCTAS